MHLLRHWWTHPIDYGWAVHHYLTSRALSWTRIAIGFWCWLFAAVAGLTLFTPAGPAGALPRTIVTALAVSALIAGAAWTARGWPGKRLSVAFVVYADVGVTAVFASMSQHLTMFPGIALLAVVGSYIATFHDARVFLAHQLFSLFATATLFGLAVAEAGADVALALMYLTVVALVQFSVPVLTQGLLLLLRHAATGALFDPLTGLRNRRGLQQELAGSFTGIRFDQHACFVVLVIDLDDFKAVNDRHGHLCGDAVLTAVAAYIRSVFPAPAVSCRSGGEEFTVLMHEPLSASVEHAHRLCERIALDTGVTVSIGVSAHQCHPACAHETSMNSTYTSLLRSADAAMYEGKRSGGNAVTFRAEAPD